MATAVPKNVSPLIRAGRWSLLLTGLVYGRIHHNTLKKREERARPKEIDRVTHHAIEEVAEQKIKADQSMIDLAYAAGIDPNQARVKKQEHAEKHH
ncbi:unnamed protein product [Rotaria sp. Silwood2]|nr:unnamed protein product [Rotaria sp. Silwood2]CAF3001342.1 unnamed protein product [Rotaria sp. Silwood2]CAF3355305.1 unnamed protein product [Rotaria sp. Silwood2]CAF4311756.1 unnamed protein product [Rotaria sp. Silwood2]CAF4350944.1 unnamed protein product [Rotaria sp. Silwood2]